MPKASKEMRESHIFKVKDLCECVYACIEDDVIGQEGATRKEENDQKRDLG